MEIGQVFFTPNEWTHFESSEMTGSGSQRMVELDDWEGALWPLIGSLARMRNTLGACSLQTKETAWQDSAYDGRVSLGFDVRDMEISESRWDHRDGRNPFPLEGLLLTQCESKSNAVCTPQVQQTPHGVTFISSVQQRRTGPQPPDPIKAATSLIRPRQVLLDLARMPPHQSQR